MCIYKYTYYTYIHITHNIHIYFLQRKALKASKRTRSERKQILREASFGFNIKCGLLGLLAPPLTQMCLPCTCIESPRAPTYHRTNGVLCSWNIANAVCEGDGRHGSSMYLLSSHAQPIVSLGTLDLLYLQIQVQGKMLKNFRTAIAEN